MVMDVIWCRLCVSMILEGVIYFFLSWARVRRKRRGSISSELIMCGGGVIALVARCLKTVDVWRMFVFMFVVVSVWGFVGIFFLCSGRCEK